MQFYVKFEWQKALRSSGFDNVIMPVLLFKLIQEWNS